MFFFNFILCNFLVRMLQYFAHKKLKKHPEKLLRKTQIHFFSLSAWAVQTSQTEGFMLQNVVYRPTVYRTVAIGNNCALAKEFTITKLDLNGYQGRKWLPTTGWASSNVPRRCHHAAARRRLLFCQKLGGQLPTLPIRHLRPWTKCYGIILVKIFFFHAWKCIIQGYFAKVSFNTS